MMTFLKIGAVEYHENQRRQFLTKLRHDWQRRYRMLFDRDDFRRTKKRTKPYYFYEWLGAILLHHSTGYCAFVTKYQFDRTKRGRLETILPHRVLEILDDRVAWGRKQGPDLLMYAPDGSDWFFCEVKGPGDTVKKHQRSLFRALVKASGKRIRLLEFRETSAPNRRVQPRL